MLRKILFASVLALGAAGAAQAQDSGPRLIGGGTEAKVVYAQPSNNVAGGAVASINGGGDNLQVVYGQIPASHLQTGMTAELVGGGADAQVVYDQAAPFGSMLAGQMTHTGG